MEASGQACLFGGEVEEPLNQAAPYLVNLKAQEPLFRALRTAGRGQAWGIMCRSGLPLDGLRRHFRHFLMAKLPDGTVAQFLYDPRVFNPFLSSCTPDWSWGPGSRAYPPIWRKTRRPGPFTNSRCATDSCTTTWRQRNSAAAHRNHFGFEALA